MKKKIKIFSTIASLCLAVALMAFGVYAATQIGMTAESTISFTSTDIAGYWSAGVYSEKGTVEAGHKYTLSAEADELVQVTETVTTDKTDKVAADTKITLPSVVINDTGANDTTVIIYRVAFTATGANAVANLTVNATASGDNAAAVVITETQKSQSGATSESEKTKEFTITVTYTNANINVTQSKTAKLTIVANATK